MTDTKQENAMRMMLAVSFIDECLLTEAYAAEQRAGRREKSASTRENRVISGIAAAACLCAVLFGLYFILPGLPGGPAEHPTASPLTSPTEPAETGEQPTEAETAPVPDIPGVRLFGENPYDGMTEQDLLALWRQADTGVGIDAVPRSTPFLFFTEMINEITVFDKRTGCLVKAADLFDGARDIFDNRIHGVAVSGSWVFVLMEKNDATGWLLYAFDLHMQNPRLLGEWGPAEAGHVVFAAGGKAYIPLFVPGKSNGYTAVVDPDTGSVTPFLLPGTDTSDLCFCFRDKLYFRQKDNSVLCVSPADGESYTVIPSSVVNGMEGMTSFSVDAAIEDGARLLINFVCGKKPGTDSIQYAWYDTRTGTLTDAPDGCGIVLDDECLFVRREQVSAARIPSTWSESGSLCLTHGDAGSERLLSLTVGGVPAPVPKEGPSARLLTYDGKCLYTLYTESPDFPYYGLLVLDVDSPRYLSTSDALIITRFPDRESSED